MGSGEKIRVLEDPWLPDKHPWVTSVHESLRDIKVARLKHVGTNEWDLDLLEDLFNARDINLIKIISLSNSHRLDRLIWFKETTGVYTVKSAYRLLQEERGTRRKEDESWFWKRFLHLKSPPKIKNLVCARVRVASHQRPICAKNTPK